MNLKHLLTLLLFITTVAVAKSSFKNILANSISVNHTAFDQLLRANISDNGMVNYKAINNLKISYLAYNWSLNGKYFQSLEPI